MHVNTINQKIQTQLADHRKLHRKTFEYSYFFVITTFIEQTAILIVQSMVIKQAQRGLSQKITYRRSPISSVYGSGIVLNCLQHLCPSFFDTVRVVGGHCDALLDPVSAAPVDTPSLFGLTVIDTTAPPTQRLV